MLFVCAWSLMLFVCAWSLMLFVCCSLTMPCSARPLTARRFLPRCASSSVSRRAPSGDAKTPLRPFLCLRPAPPWPSRRARRSAKTLFSKQTCRLVKFNKVLDRIFSCHLDYVAGCTDPPSSSSHGCNNYAVDEQGHCPVGSESVVQSPWRVYCPQVAWLNKYLALRQHM